ncbi:hypothetical protein LMG8526HA_02425 [Lactococcus lactis]|nr:hypothetical protein [Lactococcus lactis]
MKQNTLSRLMKILHSIVQQVIYHVDGESKEKPTGSTSLVKYDADTNNTDTQGKGDWDGIVFMDYFIPKMILLLNGLTA